MNRKILVTLATIEQQRAGVAEAEERANQLAYRNAGAAMGR